jgi:hypothetical protein
LKECTVEAQSSIVRQITLPMYGSDQLLFVSLFVLVLSLSSLLTHDRELTVYGCIGAYVGFVFSMQRSTPSVLILPSEKKSEAITIINNSSYMVRSSADTWKRNVSRFRRWDSDTVRLVDRGNSLAIFGRRVDLEKMCALLNSD